MNNNASNRFDFLVIGGGIIGLTVARELVRRRPGATICLIEKESDVAQHASGRNSGVLHAGFYYTADSLKARFTRDGNREMHAWCREQGLRINPCGKLVVAADEAEDLQLEELKRRGDSNGVTLEWVDDAEARQIDPNAKTWRRALWSPNTSTIDPREVCAAMKRQMLEAGVNFRLGTAYQGCDGQIIKTSTGLIEAGIVVNCAGLYADRIARDFGFGSEFVIIPFKGIYLKYSGHQMNVRTNIYPVPNLANPFLGVHFTVKVDGSVKIGPTAIPAFWRENYSGLSRFSWRELLETGWCEASLFLTNRFGFRSLTIEEWRKYYRPHFVGLAAKLVHSLDVAGFRESSEPGIRAQLYEPRTGKLVQDFVVQGDSKSIHVLNAVSPAFTCSFPMARHVVDKIGS